MSPAAVMPPDEPYRKTRAFLRGLCRVLVHLLFRVRYEGTEHIPAAGPAVLVANHTSMIDMFAIHIRVRPWIHWVAKKELFRYRLPAAFFRLAGCIPVDRSRADLSAARGIIGALRQGRLVGMFPQGTRVKSDEINQIKPRSGAVHFAAKTGAPLIPVAISGSFRLFHRVRIVFGEPYWLPAGRELDFNGLSIEMMQRIYGLIGRPYHPDDQAEKQAADRPAVSKP